MESYKMTKEEKQNFIIRACMWVLFSCVIPVLFIGYRYDLFKKAGELQLSGWGLIALVIVFVFCITFVKYIKSGMTEWSMLKQVLNGVGKVIIPLMGLLCVIMAISSNIKYFEQALCCVIICEAIAIPINPFPQWIYKKTNGKLESTLDFLANKIKGDEK